MPIFENYPVNLAQQIEVVYGPASALYGADAVSGVINIITKKAPSRKDILVNISSSVGTYGQANNSVFVAKKLADHADFTISGQYFYDRQPDYTKLYSKEDSLFSPNSLKTGVFNTIYGPNTPTAPISPQYGAPMSAYNLYGALHLDNLTIALFSNYARTPTTFGTNTNNGVYNRDVYASQHINMAELLYKRSFRNITSSSSLTASKYLMSPNSNVRVTDTDLEPSYLYATGSMVKMEEQIDWIANERLNFTGGASYASYYSIPDPGGLDEPLNGEKPFKGSYHGTDHYYLPDGLPASFNVIRYDNIGTFLETHYSPNQKIDLTLGARYDINSGYWNTLNPRLGIVFSPFDKTTIKALYGTAFLAPSPSASYLQYGSFETQDSGRTSYSNFMHLPNPGLKPVVSHSTELSVRQYITDNFNISLDGYYTELTNLQTNEDDNKSTHLYHNAFAGASIYYVEVTVNQGKQVSYGGSMQLNYKNKFGRLKLNAYASLSYTGGHVTTPDRRTAELESISPFIVHLGTDFKVGKFTCSPRLTLLSKQNLSGFSDTTMAVIKRQTIAGYALATIALRYNISKKCSFFANVTNALNQDYRSVGPNMDLNKKPTDIFYGQHEDPIRIAGGLNFTF
jgi:outer membrane receptor protein involved in Fe transport